MTQILETSDASFTLFSEHFNTSYHSIHGAVQESNVVYISAGLQFYWQKHGADSAVNIFEMGFGSGLNAWLTYIIAREKSAKIRYTAIEKFPISDEVAKSYCAQYRSHPDHETLAALHCLPWQKASRLSSDFLILLQVEDFLSMPILEQYDVMYYDAFGPSTQPELWSIEAVSKMAQMMVSGGVLVTFCAQGNFKRLLKDCGFEVNALPGPKGKREITQAIKI